MAKVRTIYDQSVEVSKEFLGPAGERFMRRQIDMHLGVAPEKLTGKQLSELVNWVKLASAMLTANANHVDAFAASLEGIAQEAVSKRKIYAKHR